MATLADLATPRGRASVAGIINEKRNLASFLLSNSRLINKADVQIASTSFSRWEKEIIRMTKSSVKSYETVKLSKADTVGQITFNKYDVNFNFRRSIDAEKGLIEGIEANDKLEGGSAEITSSKTQMMADSYIEDHDYWLLAEMTGIGHAYNSLTAYEQDVAVDLTKTNDEIADLLGETLNTIAIDIRDEMTFQANAEDFRWVFGTELSHILTNIENIGNERRTSQFTDSAQKILELNGFKGAPVFVTNKYDTVFSTVDRDGIAATIDLTNILGNLTIAGGISGFISIEEIFVHPAAYYFTNVSGSVLTSNSFSGFFSVGPEFIFNFYKSGTVPIWHTPTIPYIPTFNGTFVTTESARTNKLIKEENQRRLDLQKKVMEPKIAKWKEAVNKASKHQPELVDQILILADRKMAPINKVEIYNMTIKKAKNTIQKLSNMADVPHEQRDFKIKNNDEQKKEKKESKKDLKTEKTNQTTNEIKK